MHWTFVTVLYLWSTVHCIIGGGGGGVVGTRHVGGGGEVGTCHILTYGLLYHWSTVS